MLADGRRARLLTIFNGPLHPGSPQRLVVRLRIRSGRNSIAIVEAPFSRFHQQREVLNVAVTVPTIPLFNQSRLRFFFENL